MHLFYATRLRHDLQDWQSLGLIQPDQAERIAAHALAPRDHKSLQTVLGLCIVLLLAPAIIAFVAANWSALSAAARMAILFVTDIAAVSAAYLAARHRSRAGIEAPSKLVDGLATLSLVTAATTLALVGQTFHTPPDPQGFALTVAVLGLATAAVARSGSAAAIACVALILADNGSGGMLGLQGAPASRVGIGFWIVGTALFLMGLLGWTPVRKITLFLLLVALTDHIGIALDRRAGSLTPDLTLAVAALAITLGHALTALEAEGSWIARLRTGAQALTQAGVGLFLIDTVFACLQFVGLARSPTTATTYVAIVALGCCAFALHHIRKSEPIKPPISDLLMLGAATLSLCVWILASQSREMATLWTVWGGIVPALILIVAGDIDRRPVLYGSGIALTAALTLGMLAMSKNLIAFSGNLVVCAIALGFALLGCRWAARRITRRLA